MTDSQLVFDKFDNRVRLVGFDIAAREIMGTWFTFSTVKHDDDDGECEDMLIGQFIGAQRRRNHVDLIGSFAAVIDESNFYLSGKIEGKASAEVVKWNHFYFADDQKFSQGTIV